MQIADIFRSLLDNLKVGETHLTVSSRRDEITKALNKHFRSKEGSTGHRLMVGSYGRHTAIRGVSDLDMLYILPADSWSKYSDENGPRRILTRVKDTLQARYPHTEVRVDECVVRVRFTSNAFTFEVQPVFENEDKSFSYPDSVEQRWKTTRPREERHETRECNERTSNNLRHLARMIRAWKNTHGVTMGGLLIDTLVHRFFSTTDTYNSADPSSHGLMVRDFFKFLADADPDRSYYLALGSNQHVYVRKRFQPKAKKAYNLCLEALDMGGATSANDKWRAVFGPSVPPAVSEINQTFDDTAEFIEDQFPIDIRHSLTIDCEVTQDGWRPMFLRDLLQNKRPLLPGRALDFSVIDCSVERPYELRWKVLNRGKEAERRNEIRGQIIESNRKDGHYERSKFKGEHIVECFVVQNGIVVARDRIDVPIDATSES